LIAPLPPHYFLLQRDKTRRVGSTNTGTTVLNRLVCDSELSQVVSNHLSLKISQDRVEHLAYPNFNSGEGLSIVNTNYGSDHLRYDDHVAKMGLHSSGSLVLSSKGLCLSQLLDQGKLFAVQTASELSASTAREQLHKLLVAQVQEVIEFNTSVGELFEYTFLFLDLRGHGDSSGGQGCRGGQKEMYPTGNNSTCAENPRIMATPALPDDYDPLVPQRVENAIKKRLQELSLIDCEDEVSIFANCVKMRFGVLLFVTG
jgi:hypothetical protein